LALGGSYERAFQNYLIEGAKKKTGKPAPVVALDERWSGVIDTLLPEAPEVASKRKAKIKRATELITEAQKPDLDHGRQLAKGLCLSCHSIQGEGAGFAPPLDGSSQRDIHALVTAIFDPNQAAENIFRAYRIEKKSGEVIEGFLGARTATQLTVMIMGGAEIEVPVSEIKKAGYVNGKSAMLDIFQDALSDEHVIDLVRYLRTVK
ncbi:MAG: c-type cytochrome, partial [Verrucomicrobiota bacterium]